MGANHLKISRDSQDHNELHPTRFRKQFTVKTLSTLHVDCVLFILYTNNHIINLKL